MQTIKVTFANGDTVTTSVSRAVSRDDICDYYLQNTFYLGDEATETPTRAVSVEYLD